MPDSPPEPVPPEIDPHVPGRPNYEGDAPEGDWVNTVEDEKDAQFERHLDQTGPADDERRYETGGALAT